MKYIPYLIVLWALIFVISLCMNLNAKEEKPCLKCLKEYLSCQSEVHTLSKEDQKVAKSCEDTYYDCFHGYKCYSGRSQ